MHSRSLFWMIATTVVVGLSSGARSSVAVVGASDDAVAASMVAFDDGAFEDAERLLLRHLETADKDHQAWYALARTRVALARNAQGLEAVDRALALAPEDARYHRLRGDTLGRMAQEASVFKQIGLAKRCLASLERAVELDPRSIDARHSILEYYLRAPGFMGGSLTKARAQADAIGVVNPAKGLRAHGRIHRYRNETADALEDYRAAVEADLHDRDIRYDFGTYLIELEYGDEARLTFEAMLTDDADDLRALFGLGHVAAVVVDDLVDGKVALERYLDRPVRFDHPSHADAQYHLGRIHAHLGDTSAARKAYEAALALDPEHDRAPKALRRLE